MTPAQKEALMTADKIVDRAKAGVSVQRLWADGEAMQFVQAYVILRETLAMMAEHAADQHQRTTDYMNV
jgi:hypothetical protein